MHKVHDRLQQGKKHNQQVIINIGHVHVSTKSFIYKAHANPSYEMYGTQLCLNVFVSLACNCTNYLVSCPNTCLKCLIMRFEYKQSDAD